MTTDDDSEIIIRELKKELKAHKDRIAFLEKEILRLQKIPVFYKHGIEPDAW